MYNAFTCTTRLLNNEFIQNQRSVMNATIMDDALQYIVNEVIISYVPEYFLTFEYTPWIFSLIGSALIGLSGILPLALIPVGAENKDGEASSDRKYLYLCNTTIT